MQSLTLLARTATLAFLGTLALIVLYRIAAGEIPLRGLLTENGPGADLPRRLSAPRAQLLVVTVLAAGATLAGAVSQFIPPLATARAVAGPLPSALMVGLPVAVGLSNAFFLWHQYRRATRPS